jgi:hypothetical protein
MMKISTAQSARNTETPPRTPPTIGPTRSPPGAPAPTGTAGLVVELGVGEVCEAWLVCDVDDVTLEVEVEEMVGLDIVVPVTDTEMVG